jgi:hypothetical protein
VTRGGRGGTKHRKINLNASASKSKTAQSTFTPGPPLKPRRKLFVGLLVALGAWIAILLTLYFATIYPRHVPGDIRPPEATGTAS